MCNIVFAYNILMILYLSAASEEFLELTRSALLAALEGLQLLIQNDILISLLYELCLRSVDFSFIFFPSFAAVPSGALFGLATFSHKIGLYDVQGAIPVVKNVFIPSDTEDTLSLELEDVMPLSQFLAPVC